MDYAIIVPLITLIGLEIILGIDNIVFISLLTGTLPLKKRKKARSYGLFLAALLRIVLLSLISMTLKFESELFKVFNKGFSVKDLILIAGGLFLLYKSTREIYFKMEGEPSDIINNLNRLSFTRVVFQIVIMDLIFSIDSIITVIGIVREIWVMIVAIIITVGLMIAASEPIGKFINKHPAFKMLALSFLFLIGFTLVAEGLGIVIPKSYIYFSMAFSFLVNLLQVRMNRKKSISPVHTKERYIERGDHYPEDIL
jgi:predicted tellurium resistance membrane protein TerC